MFFEEMKTVENWLRYWQFSDFPKSKVFAQISGHPNLFHFPIVQCKVKLINRVVVGRIGHFGLVSYIVLQMIGRKTAHSLL